MNKKQWYVIAEVGYKKKQLQFMNTKKDAVMKVKELKDSFQIVYIDFIWKADNHLPYTKTIGKNFEIVESIKSEPLKITA